MPACRCRSPLRARADRRTDDERTRKAIANAASQTRETIRELRTLLVDIYPPTLQRSGLLAALHDLVAPLKSAGIAVTLSVPSSLELSSDTEALFYRVAQEAIRNARSHGEATEISVIVQRDGRRAVLRVVDNGRGFSPEGSGESDEPRHFGLRLMHDLADHADGELEVSSAPGQGTSVRLEVPA